jgi:predicted deacetylase
VAVHVSIHDVSPGWASEVEGALGLCSDVGVKPALLVVPDFHGRWPLGRHPDFCARLRALQAGGHEIYLHGYFHKAGFSDAAPGEDGKPTGLRRVFAQRIVSGSEAEMSDLSRAEAQARLDDGERVLAEAGLRVDGYVAPAWSMPPWLLPLLESRRYAFTEDHTHVYAPSRKEKRASLVLNFASRTPARMASTVAFCRLAKPARRLFPTRIAIHPGDMRHAILRHEVRHLLSWARGDYVARGPDLLGASLG